MMISNSTKEKFLIYHLMEKEFCTPILQIKEIFHPDKIIKLPRVSPVLLGVVNLRGKIISVFNPLIILWGTIELASLTENNTHSTILLLTWNDHEYGIFIENIPKIMEISKFKEIDSKYLKDKKIPDLPHVKKVGLLESEKEILFLDLQALLKSYIALDSEIKVPSSDDIDDIDDLDPNQFLSKEEISEEDKEEEFNIDQYTLPE